MISVRVPEDVATAIDKARGARSRSSWAEQVLTERVDPARTQPPRKQVDTPRCPPHPRGRIIKGFCYRCGKPAT